MSASVHTEIGQVSQGVFGKPQAMPDFDAAATLEL